jgi:hypothetical protein
MFLKGDLREREAMSSRERMLAFGFVGLKEGNK